MATAVAETREVRELDDDNESSEESNEYDVDKDDDEEEDDEEEEDEDEEDEDEESSSLLLLLDELDELDRNLGFMNVTAFNSACSCATNVSFAFLQKSSRLSTENFKNCVSPSNLETIMRKARVV